MVSSLKSTLPFISSSLTLSGICFNSSITSSGKSTKNPWRAPIAFSSISGSSLCPTICFTSPLKIFLSSNVASNLFLSSTSTKLPDTSPFKFSFGHIILMFPYIL